MKALLAAIVCKPPKSGMVHLDLDMHVPYMQWTDDKMERSFAGSASNMAYQHYAHSSCVSVFGADSAYAACRLTNWICSMQTRIT